MPEHAGDFVQLPAHGGDQLILILVKDGPPLVLGFEVDEVFGVVEADGIQAVIGPADAGDDLFHFRE